MSDVRKIRQEIINAIKEKRGDKVPDDLWKKIETELDFCEITEGLEGKNNLQTLYNIWQKRKTSVGTKNEINSWTAYALGITSCKPNGEFLFKRRAFARAGFPDIDVDFEDSRQNDVFEYLVETYGRDKGGRIGTHQFLTFKSCITRVVKALDLADAFHKGKDAMTTENAKKVSEILSPFPKGGIIRLRGNDGEMHIIKTIKDALEHCSDFKYYMDKYPLLKKYSLELENNFSAFGCLSADTPILTNKGWVRIDQLTTKLKVAYVNKDGEIEFTNKFDSFKTGNKKTYKLKLKDGSSVNITDEHLVFTDFGCIKFEEIRKDIKKYKVCGFPPGILDIKYSSYKLDMMFFEIESIEELGFEDVYDISIAEGPDFFQAEHNYIANNIVVHNSHAAGFVVSDIPIEQIAPLRRATGDALATQFTGPELETLGLIKFDILGLSTLSVIKKCTELIKENYDIDINIENLPLKDEPTFKLYRTGNLGGVFQCEQHGMQHTMREIGVDRFDDIMAGVALYRPGPMDNIPDYCARKRGEQKIDYFHRSIEPFVKKILERTYGILVYQEQIMNICNSLSGFSITEGYIMIKAIGKKKIELMEKFEKQFISGAVSNGVPEDIVKQYWDKFIVPFANYGFNAAHACCYGYNSYITAYLKANYPDEFICAILITETLKNSGTKFDKIADFEKEFKRKLDVKFLPRDINKCKLDYTIEKKKDLNNGITKTEIRPSLICKGLGWVAGVEIEKNQPFEDLRDFAAKNSSSVDTKAVLALATAGYFGSKSKKNPELLVKEFAMIKEDLKKVNKKGIESVDLFE